MPKANTSAVLGRSSQPKGKVRPDRPIVPVAVQNLVPTEPDGSDVYPVQIYWPTVDNNGMAPDNPLPPHIRQFLKAQNLPQNWVRPFLSDLREHGLLQHAVDYSGTTREVVQVHRRQNTLFAYAYDDAMLKASEALEMVARDRAMEYSDPLMIFLLKGTNPDKFGDKISVRTESEVRSRVTELAGKFGIDANELLDLAQEILENWDPVSSAIDVSTPPGVSDAAG